LIWDILEGKGKDMMITGKKAKQFSPCLCIVNLGTIMGSSDKLNRTSKA